MRLKLYQINPVMQPYIKLICTMDCDENVDTHQIRVLPDTCVEVFLNYTETPLAIIENELHQHSIVTSRMNCSMDVRMRKGAGCIAICFQPGMAYHFFNTSMDLLSNKTIPLTNFWGQTTSHLEEKLSAAKSNYIRVEIVQQYLLELLNKNKVTVPIVNALANINFSAGLTASGLNHNFSISQRQFNRKFLQQVGLSPKAYLSANRFINSLAHLKKYPSLSLTEIAYRNGYYDQAHFIRDCKVYTGYTPSQVARDKSILY